MELDLSRFTDDERNHIEGVTSGREQLDPSKLSEKAKYEILGRTDEYEGLAVKDTALSVARGLGQLGSFAAGATNLLGLNGKPISDATKSYQDYVTSKMSPRSEDEAAQFESTKGVADTASFLATHPRFAIGMAAESAPSMAIGGGLGGLAAKGLAKAGVAAAGEMSGLGVSQLGQGMLTAGMTADQIKSANPDVDYGTLAGASLAAGGSTAALTGIFGRIGGAHDLDAAAGRLFGGAAAPKSAVEHLGFSGSGFFGKMAKSALAEGAEETLQSGPEQMALNYGTGKDLYEGVAKQMTAGGVVGGLTGGVAGVAGRMHERAQESREIDAAIAREENAQKSFTEGERVAAEDAAAQTIADPNFSFNFHTMTPEQVAALEVANPVAFKNFATERVGLMGVKPKAAEDGTPSFDRGEVYAFAESNAGKLSVPDVAAIRVATGIDVGQTVETTKSILSHIEKSGIDLAPVPKKSRKGGAVEMVSPVTKQMVSALTKSINTGKEKGKGLVRHEQVRRVLDSIVAGPKAATLNLNQFAQQEAKPELAIGEANPNSVNFEPSTLPSSSLNGRVDYTSGTHDAALQIPGVDVQDGVAFEPTKVEAPQPASTLELEDDYNARMLATPAPVADPEAIQFESPGSHFAGKSAPGVKPQPYMPGVNMESVNKEARQAPRNAYREASMLSRGDAAMDVEAGSAEERMRERIDDAKLSNGELEHRRDLRALYGFADSRKANKPFFGSNFSGASLQIKFLQGLQALSCDFSNSNLSGADLNQANLTGSNLSSVKATETVFANSKMHNATLDGADLSASDFERAELFGASIKGSNMMNANLWHAYMDGVKLDGSNLNGADLRQAELRGVNLINVNIFGANLSETQLQSATLTDEQIEYASEQGAYLSKDQKQRLAALLEEREILNAVPEVKPADDDVEEDEWGIPIKKAKPRDSSGRLSAAATTGAGMSTAQFVREGGVGLARMINKGSVRVVSGPEMQKISGHDRAAGFFIDGKIYLNKDMIAPGNVKGVLFHEFAHMIQLSEFGGERGKALMDKLRNDYDKALSKEASSELDEAALVRMSADENVLQDAEYAFQEFSAYKIEEMMKAKAGFKAIIGTGLGRMFSNVKSSMASMFGMSPSIVTNSDVLLAMESAIDHFLVSETGQASAATQARASTVPPEILGKAVEIDRTHPELMLAMMQAQQDSLNGTLDASGSVWANDLAAKMDAKDEEAEIYKAMEATAPKKSTGGRLSIGPGADLSGANLSGANLSGANIFGAFLPGANLRGANLRGANLTDITHSNQPEILEELRRQAAESEKKEIDDFLDDIPVQPRRNVSSGRLSIASSFGDTYDAALQSGKNIFESVAGQKQKFGADGKLQNSTKMNRIGWLQRVLPTVRLIERFPQLRPAWDDMEMMLGQTNRMASSVHEIAPRLMPASFRGNLVETLDGISRSVFRSSATSDAVSSAIDRFGSAIGAPRMTTQDRLALTELVNKMDPDAKNRRFQTYHEAQSAVKSLSPEAWDVYQKEYLPLVDHLQNTKATGMIIKIAEAALGGKANLSSFMRNSDIDGLVAKVKADIGKAIDATDYSTRLGKVESRSLAKAASMIDQVIQLRDEAVARAYLPLTREGKYGFYVKAGSDTKGITGYERKQFTSAAEAQKAFDSIPPELKLSQKELEDVGLDASSDGILRLADRDIMPQFITIGAIEDILNETASYGNDENGKPLINPVAAKIFKEQALRMIVEKESARMQREMHRKGVGGFDMDLQKVLSKWAMNTAQTAAKDVYYERIARSMKALNENSDGDLRQYVNEVMQFMENPSEPALIPRAMLTTYMLSSAASAMMNVTSGATNTLPFLNQFSGIGNVAKIIGDATVRGMKYAATGRVAPEFERYMDGPRAAGRLEPGETQFMIGMAQGSGPASKMLSHGSKAMMSMFAVTETGNRMATAIASGKVFEELMATPEGRAKMEQFFREKNLNMAEGNAPDMATFQNYTIDATQMVLNKSNTPPWARSGAGALAFTFKNYSLGVLTLMESLPWKQKIVMLGMFTILSGLGGLPFEDDLLDLVETMAAATGHPINAKQEAEDFIKHSFELAFGKGSSAAKTATGLTMRGISEFLPFDISQRAGMPNIIPATQLFNLSKPTAVTDSLKEIAGPVAGLAQKFYQGGVKLVKGDLMGVINFMPSFAASPMVGLMAAADGHFVDSNGNPVAPASLMDGFIKALGFQTDETGEIGRLRRENQSRKDRAAFVKSIAVNDIVKFSMDGNSEGRAKVLQSIKDWNDANPDARVNLADVNKAAFKLARDMRMNPALRMSKTANKNDRAEIMRRYEEIIKGE